MTKITYICEECDSEYVVKEDDYEGRCMCGGKLIKQ